MTCSSTNIQTDRHLLISPGSNIVLLSNADTKFHHNWISSSLDKWKNLSKLIHYYKNTATDVRPVLTRVIKIQTQTNNKSFKINFSYSELNLNTVALASRVYKAL